MKNIYALATGLLMSGAMFAANVTFKVNMNNQTVSANGVHVAGSFQNWDPAGTPMTDPDMDGIYEATVTIADGQYVEFKFLNGNAWGDEESVPAGAQVGGGNGNRWAWIGSTTAEVGPICFGEVVNCGMSAVTMQVNMATQTVSSLGVHVAGSFQGWDPAGTMMHNPDGGFIYKYILETTDATALEWKYINGDAWGDDEGVPSACAVNGNRGLTVAGDTLMDAVCFGACDPCVSSMVTLRVDMSNETVSSDGVHVAGSFQGWDPAGTELLDGDADGIYETVVPIQPGTIEFKFVNGNAWGSEEGVPAACNSNGNRSLTISPNDTTYTVCFGTCTWPCVAFPDTSMVTFSVEIPDTISVSADPDSGGVWIMGSFTSPKWQDGAIMMTDNGDGTYSYTAEIGGAPDNEFKFVLGKPNTTGAEEESGDFEALGCGIVNPVSTPNRFFARTANDTTMAYCWNQCVACEDVDNVSEIVGTVGYSVYPNPSEGFTNIVFNENGVYSVIVYDLTGKVLYKGSNNGSNQIEINGNQFHQGIYLIQVSDAEGNTSTTKWIVQ